MAEYVESEEEKQELDKKNRRVLKDLENAIEQQSKKFVDTWEHELANTVPNSKIIDIPELPDEDHEHRATAIEIELDGGETERWIFYTYDNPRRWLAIFKQGWWKSKGLKDKEFWENGYLMEKAENDDINYKNYRIQFKFTIKYHRTNWFEKYSQHKKTPQYKMFSDKKIRLVLATGSKEKKAPFQSDSADIFRKSFSEKITDRIKSNKEKYPEETEIYNSAAKSGKYKRAVPIRIVNDIPIKSYDHFYDAYLAKLSDIFCEVVINRNQLLKDINKCIKEVKEEENLKVKKKYTS